MIIRMAGTDRGKNRQVMFVLYYLFKVVYITNRKPFQLLLLTVNISSQGLFSALNSIIPLHCLPQGLKSFLQIAQRQVPFLFGKKGKLAEMTTLCHSVLFVVTRCLSLSLVVPLLVTSCTTFCRSLYHSLSFVVTRCHSVYHSYVFL